MGPLNEPKGGPKVEPFDGPKVGTLWWAQKCDHLVGPMWDLVVESEVGPLGGPEGRTLW